MKNLFTILAACVLILGIGGCGADETDKEKNGDGINWNDEPDGTLTIINNSSKDVVLFRDSVPSAVNILGGVRAGTERIFDLSWVSDFEDGGYMLIQGMSLDEYNENKSNLSAAQCRYKALVAYKQGAKFLTEINAGCFGGYCFTVSNNDRNFGLQLRKNRPEGEIIGYVSKLEMNRLIYVDSSDAITVYPVYVAFITLTRGVISVTPTSEDAVTVIPSLPGENESVYTFSGVTSDQFADFSFPMAAIQVINNTVNCSLMIGNTILISQSGYSEIKSGRMDTFELLSTGEGREMNIYLALQDGIDVPVKLNGADPVIKNGYVYYITIEQSGNELSGSSDDYSAVIVEGPKLDISDYIASP